MHDKRKEKVMKILDIKADIGSSFFFLLFFSLFTPPRFEMLLLLLMDLTIKRDSFYSAGHNQSTVGRGILGITRGDCLSLESLLQTYGSSQVPTLT